MIDSGTTAVPNYISLIPKGLIRNSDIRTRSTRGARGAHTTALPPSSATTAVGACFCGSLDRLERLERLPSIDFIWVQQQRECVQQASASMLPSK